jgi:predicted nucleotidyltransferase
VKRTILEAIVGSTVHGTAVQDGLEDLDLMAVVLEEARAFVGFFEEDTWTQRTKPVGVRSEAGDVDYVAYGLKKYLRLALKSNPSVLLLLFAPDSHVRSIDQVGHELRGLAPDIVSRQAFSPFRGYMRQQHERLLNLRGQRNVTRPELVEAYGYDTKYAAHIIRLGYQGEELLQTGRISLPMPEAQREVVLAVRTGKHTLAQASEMILEAEARLVEAHASSPLSALPNRKRVEEWMIETYLAHWRSGD